MLIVFLDFALMMPFGVSKWKFSFSTLVRVLRSLLEYFFYPPCFSVLGAIFNSIKMLQLLLLYTVAYIVLLKPTVMVPKSTLFGEI